MYIERLILTNFRCFGPEPHTVWLGPCLTAFVGSNGSGKTAMMLALLRLFGVSAEQRRVRRQDFHVPANEDAAPLQRTFNIEVILAFPELTKEESADEMAVPAFFHHMAAEEGGKLKCRLRLEATWSDDGSIDGNIEVKSRAIRTMDKDFRDDQCSDLSPVDRQKIQMIYIPASRDGASQVTHFLRSRLWKAVSWSDELKSTLQEAGTALNNTFSDEEAVGSIAGAIERRWKQTHGADIDARPVLRPVNLDLAEFVRKVEVAFQFDEAGRERPIEELSDGQRSLFHIAMTAAALDVEEQLVAGEGGFQQDTIALPVLTLIGLEEPENNLAPFYLSRIVAQIEDLTSHSRAQAVISSHSASILSRVEPRDVRHFYLDRASRSARVRSIRLPSEKNEDAAKFVREAVRIYPELYFARFVVLGEGASEEVVLPRLAEARGIPIDRSFVAVVPLGGRHINHLWRLLSGLEIPYATLLDLDYGREGGGWGRVKNVCVQLLENGIRPDELFGEGTQQESEKLGEFDTHNANDEDALKGWARDLQVYGVFFAGLLDLDMLMFSSYEAAYKAPEPGMRGPSGNASSARSAVLGHEGADFYDKTWDERFRWYRYLFLGRGKPSTHMRVLSGMTDDAIAAAAPEELTALLDHIKTVLALPDPDEI